MKVKFKKMHKNAVIPQYAKDGDAGLDLVAVEKIKDKEGDLWFDVGLAVEIPEGYVGLIFPRSSISKKDLVLANSVGVIDSGFRGSIQCRYRKTEKGKFIEKYDVGDKVCQLIIIPYPKIEPVEVKDLSESVRGSGGFGSTDESVDDTRPTVSETVKESHDNVKNIVENNSDIVNNQPINETKKEGNVTAVNPDQMIPKNIDPQIANLMHVPDGAEFMTNVNYSKVEHANICPVCEGRKKIRYDNGKLEICPTCKGQGRF